MKKREMSKSLISSLGLLLITVWSAVQYLFLQNVPDTVSTFSFLCITNLVGLVILGLTQIRRLKQITKKTLLKGAAMSVELIGFNFFLLLGSREMNTLVISSVVSMYFAFVAPILLLCRRKVSFRSGVAVVVAVIALLLLFDVDFDAFAASAGIIYLVIADVFFAAYVVTVSIFGENEDSALLTVSQMTFATVLSFVGWCIEAALGHGSLSLCPEPGFWVSVLFIGVFIRALYTRIQIGCQKNVAPINASLIFSSEIIITLILNPLLSRLMKVDYTPVTIYQVIGCVLFVVAVLVTDDELMKKFGYYDMDYEVEQGEGKYMKVESPLSRKIVNMNLMIGLGALVLCTIICLTSIFGIRGTVLEESSTLGREAAATSENALMEELEKELTQASSDKAGTADARLKSYAAAIQGAADYAGRLLSHPEDYAEIEVLYPCAENGGVWTMQRSIASKTIAYEDVREQNLLLGNLEAVFSSIAKNYDNISTMYIGTEEGLLISYDTNSDYAEAPGQENYYEYRASEWYNMARKASAPTFTEAYQDGYGRGLTISCVTPVLDEDGSFRGAVAVDILMKDMNAELVNDGISEPSKAVLIDRSGNIIASADVDPDSTEELNIFDSRLKSPLRDVSGEVLLLESGLAKTDAYDEENYVAYSTISSTDWVLCVISPVDEIVEPAVEIRNNIDSNTEKVTVAIVDGIRGVLASCLVLFALFLLVITYFVGRAADKITRPLKTLVRDVEEISQGNLDQRTQVTSTDEIGNLAHAFNEMTQSLQHYIADLTDATAKAERISSELTLATNIQADMLPSTFPAFPERKEFDLYATMTPAKEVGGDFYDYFFIDRTHLGVAIADVSGKGVGAALFMVIAKTLIKNRALLGGRPSDVLAFVNNQLCENNKAEMFVTAWFGILDLETGKLIAANAGHEFPVMKQKDGKFELIKDRHGFVLAGMEDSFYKDYELQMNPGDTLYVYTDGVPEANDDEGKFYGTDRMVEALNSVRGDACEDVVRTVRADIDSFSRGAPQFDDITMVCLHLVHFTEPGEKA